MASGQGCVAAGLRGCAGRSEVAFAVWLLSGVSSLADICLPAWLPGCLAGCLAAWLPVWLFGCLAVWLAGWLAGVAALARGRVPLLRAAGPT